MNFLCLHTAGGRSAAGLFRGRDFLAQREIEAGRTQSQILVPVIHELLTETGLTPQDIQAIALTTGPGSFTGIRVGLAAAAGFQLVHDTPVLGFDVFETLAAAVGDSATPFYAPFYALAPGRTGEVYGQLYEGGLKNGEVTVFPRDAQPENSVSFEPDMGQAPSLSAIEALAKMAATKDLTAITGMPDPVYLRPADVSLPKNGA